RYDTNLELHNCDDVVHVTESGMYYSKKLITDVTYLQETLLTAYWPDDDLPEVDYRVITQRFKALKYCIKKIMEYDVIATGRFLDWLPVLDPGGVTVRLISNSMLWGAGKATLGILKSSMETTKSSSDQFLYLEQLKDWRSLVIDGINNAHDFNKRFKKVLGTKQLQVQKLVQLEGQYKKITLGT